MSCSRSVRPILTLGSRENILDVKKRAFHDAKWTPSREAKSIRRPNEKYFSGSELRISCFRRHLSTDQPSFIAT
jgi:hypothetical protein